jgi:hypothetical protein
MMFSIQLNNNQGVFATGSRLTGLVVVSIGGSGKVRLDRIEVWLESDVGLSKKGTKFGKELFKLDSLAQPFFSEGNSGIPVGYNIPIFLPTGPGINYRLHVRVIKKGLFASAVNLWAPITLVPGVAPVQAPAVHILNIEGGQESVMAFNHRGYAIRS